MNKDHQLENDPEHQKDLLLAQANALLTNTISTGKVEVAQFEKWLKSYVELCKGGEG